MVNSSLRFTTLFFFLLLGAFSSVAGKKGHEDKEDHSHLRSLENSVFSLETCHPEDYNFPSNLNAYFFGDPGISTYTAIARYTFNISTTFETPIAIRIYGYLEGAAWNCMAAYDVDKQDAIRTGSRPVVEVPEVVCGGTNAHNTGARAQCMIYMYAAALPTLAPSNADDFQGAIGLLGAFGAYPLPFPMVVFPDIQVCGDENEDYSDFKACVQAVASDNEYSPEVVGSAIALDMIKFAENDGWNMDGTNNGQCEYNCRPYADTTGYVPQNYPGSPGKSRIENWQPLLEDDGNGFFYRQEHVTPHIGSQAVPRVLTRQQIDQRQVSTPVYDYVNETQLVVDRLADLNDAKKLEIELFDNKVNVIEMIGIALVFRVNFQMTLEQLSLFATSYTAVETDAVILAWKEKIRIDAVRTTTVIQQPGLYGTPQEITTWAGPYQGTKTYAAKEFQPYIRTMPHSEYPSASGCICTTNLELTKAFTKIVFNDDGEDLVARSDLFPQGSSQIEPGVTPSEDLTLEYQSLEEIRDACGQSRLNGGMHFTAAVADSYTLCEGFSGEYEAYIQSLLNGSTV